MKQTILVPTDFSNNALVATRYAMELAKTLQADLHFLHAYQPFTSAFQSPLANKTDAERAEIGAQKGIASFIDAIDDISSVSYTWSIRQAGLMDAITDYIDSHTVGLVVMGTHGASGVRKDLLGSNTYDVAKKIKLPLLVVPEHTSSFKLGDIVFFTDYQQNDVKTLRSFEALFKDSSLSCKLVHIHHSTIAPSEIDEKKLNDWCEKLKKETSMDRMTAELYHLPESSDSVANILDQLGADMTLITLVDSRGFFQRLLSKSLARAIILNPKTPVLLTS